MKLLLILYFSYQKPFKNKSSDPSPILRPFSIIEVKNNILEEGIEYFTHWLSAEEGHSKKWEYSIDSKYLKKIKDNNT